MKKLLTNKIVLLSLAAATGLGLVCTGILVVVFFVFRNQILLGAAPQPACKEDRLQLGPVSYQVEMIPPPKDGTLQIPGDSEGSAFWVEGTETSPVLVLAPLAETLSGGDLTGVEAVLIQANCNRSVYTITSVQPNLPDLQSLLNQSVSGITIFYQGAGGSAVVLRGDFASQVIETFATPKPGEIQAEVSLLEIGSAADSQSLRVKIGVQNLGSSALQLASTDITLTDTKGTVTALISSVPAFPVAVKSGESVEVELIFAQPGTAEATLKVFNAEYPLDGYQNP